MTKDRNKAEDVDGDFAEAIAAADSLHDGLVTAAAQAGYIRDTLVRARPYYVAMAGQDPADGHADFVASGQQFVRSFSTELRDLSSEQSVSTDRISDAAGTAVLFGTITAAAPMTIRGLQRFQFQTNPFTNDKPSAVHRLSRVDPQLPATYEAIWEALYASRADPERAALFLMRQVFDHLFDKLSPDDEVRRSEHWTEKSGNQRAVVYRSERLAYAAAVHVKDRDRANTLMAAARQMLDLYQELNQAHARSTLDPYKARHALMAMKALLESWAAAIAD